MRSSALNPNWGNLMSIKYTGHCPQCDAAGQLGAYDIPIYQRVVWVDEETGRIEWGDIYDEEGMEEMRSFISEQLLENGQYFCSECKAEFSEGDIVIRAEEVPDPKPEVIPGGWGEDPAYPRADWQYEVTNGDTQLGYWDWVEQQKNLHTD